MVVITSDVDTVKGEAHKSEESREGKLSSCAVKPSLLSPSEICKSTLSVWH